MAASEVGETLVALRDRHSITAERHLDLMALPASPLAAEPAVPSVESFSLPGCIEEDVPEEKQCRLAAATLAPSALYFNAPRLRELIEQSHIMSTAEQPGERNPSTYAEAVCLKIFLSAGSDLNLLSLFCSEQRDLQKKSKRPLGGIQAARPQNVAELCFLLERWREERSHRKSTKQMMEEEEERILMQARILKAQRKRTDSNLPEEFGIASLIQRLLSASQPRPVRIPDTQRASVAAALFDGGLLSSTGASLSDLEELPLEQLLPPEAGVGAATKLIAAINILASIKVHAQSFEHLRSLLQQHFAHATPQPLILPPAEPPRGFGARSSFCTVQ